MMLLRSPPCSLAWLFSLLLLLSSSRHVAVGEEEGPLAFVRDKFDSLNPRGKLIAGAAAGFVGSRIVVGSAMTVVKVGVGAFIA